MTTIASAVDQNPASATRRQTGLAKSTLTVAQPAAPGCATSAPLS